MYKPSKPKSLTINDDTYELRHIFHGSYSKNYPQLMIDNKPLVGIEHLYDAPNEEDIVRAGFCIASYQENKGKWAFLPEQSIKLDYSPQLSHAFLNLNKISIDYYVNFGVEYLIIEMHDENDNWLQFVVFDESLCQKLIMHKNIMNDSLIRQTESIAFNLSPTLIDYLDSIIMHCAYIEQIDSKKFNDSLSIIQQTIGQNYGDFASEYFSDYTDNQWAILNNKERKEILINYVKSELRHLLNKT